MMGYYFWLGIDAEPVNDTWRDLAAAYGYIEADGFITVYPKVG